jgi:hypothetical protein
MNAYLLLLKKDFHAAAPWLTASAVSWLPMLALPALGGLPDQILCYLCFVTVGGVTGFLALAKIVHEDPLAGSVGFLAAKPVSRALVLAAKVTLAFAAIVLPGAFIRFAAFALAAAGPSFQELVVLLIQQLMFGGALVGAFLLPALWTSTLPRMILVTFAIATAFVVLFVAAVRIFPVSAHNRFTGDSVSAVKLILFQLTLIAAPLAAALFLAKTRRPIVAGCILCLALGGGLAAARMWFPPERSLPQVSLPASASVTLTEPPQLRSELRDNRVIDALLLSYETLGIPRDKLLFPTKVAVTFRAGAAEKTLHLKVGWADIMSSADSKSIAIKEWLGIPLDKFDFKSPERLNLTCESQSGRSFEGIEMGSIRGSIGFTVLQSKIIATLPARVGAEAISPPYRIRIVRISTTARAIEMQIDVQSLVSPFPREAELPPFLSNFWIVAKNVNEPAKSLVSRPGSGGSTRVGPLLIQNVGAYLGFGENKNIAADWERTTLIQIVSTSVVGQANLRFTTPGQKSPE